MTILASYSAVAAPRGNQLSKMKPDDNGYYRCILGAFNTENQSGTYYPFTDTVKRIFSESGIFTRRWKTGMLRGEYTHPDISKLSLEEALQRLALIEAKLVSHHIKHVILESKKDENGKDIVVVYGMVKPSGPYGQYLEDHFKNPDENVAFSVRSFVDSHIAKGKLIKAVNEVLTYDFVSEPGIKLANQFDTVTLESLKYQFDFTPADLARAINRTVVGGLEHENSTLTMVKDALGWNKIQVLRLHATDI